MGYVYYVRHGETVRNTENKVCGMVDSPLTEKGHQQAIALGKRIAEEGLPIDEILYSPLSRATDTARHISELTGIPMRPEPRIIEQHFGYFEGTDRYTEEFARARTQFADRNGDGESMLQICQRVFNVLDEIKEEADNKVYLLVAHNGIARAVNAYFNSISNEEYGAFRMDNCDILKFEFK